MALQALHVDGNRLVNSDGEPVQLRGISTHGLAWFPQYVNEDCFRQLKEEWGVDLIRLAMYTGEYGGYCSGGDREALKALIDDGVRYATELGMYVIIDWHILSDNDPNIHKDEAIAFFEEMSSKYAEQDNVLYEICNEPNGGTEWAAIRDYALEVIPVIRGNDPDGVIIVGTPNWSQFVDQAAADPITEYDNIMYTLHFYADTHRDELRDKMEEAMEAGLPIFVTEFGICDASGSGAINVEESEKWIGLMDRLGISYAAWNMSNKDETSAIFRPDCAKTSGFTADDLSESGRWLYEMFTGEHVQTEDVPAATPAGEATAIQDGIEIETKLVNSWSSDGKSFYQYTLTLTNVYGQPLDGWTVELSFTGEIALQDSWNGEYTADGSTLTVTAKDYNAAVPAGGSVSDVGFIVSGGKLDT